MSFAFGKAQTHPDEIQMLGLLGVLKITQHNSRATWAKVPMQDFASQDKIDWSQSVSEIDRQLYAKYGLTQDEIDFIETKVTPME